MYIHVYVHVLMYYMYYILLGSPTYVYTCMCSCVNVLHVLFTTGQPDVCIYMYVFSVLSVCQTIVYIEK